MKQWWRFRRPKVVSWILLPLVQLIGATLRIEMVGWEPIEKLGVGKIICGWHGRSFVAAIRYRMLGYWVIISQSRDGEIQNRIFQGLGYNIIRGSTGRGGVRAAIEAIKALKAGGAMAITPDGPRGPSGVVQGGVMLMVQKSGAALVPVGISATPRFLAGSWDRYMVPWLFARAVMVFGDPIYVPKGSGEAEVEAIRLGLQERMHELQEEAERRMGVRAPVSARLP